MQDQLFTLLYKKIRTSPFIISNSGPIYMLELIIYMREEPYFSTISMMINLC